MLLSVIACAGETGLRDDVAGPRPDDAESPARVHHPEFAAGQDDSFRPNFDFPVMELLPGDAAGPARGPMVGPGSRFDPEEAGCETVMDLIDMSSVELGMFSTALVVRAYFL